MTDEVTFLKAIADDPHDDALRLLYGDWLAQLGDPRGEFIRLCHTMRRTPVWSDEYWQLKARRNDMWESIPLEWLEATGYDGSYYDSIFRDGVPEDWRGRWRLIREFIERWRGFDTPDVGGAENEIRKLEERLQVTLPASIREFVAFVHAFGDYGPALDEYTHGPELFHCAYFCMWRTITQPAISLINYTLDSGLLTVRLDDLSKADPPTWFLYEALDEKGNYYPMESRPYHGQAYYWEPSVSLAVFQTLFIELPAANSMSTLMPNPDELIEKLKRDFPIHVRFDDADIFESDEMLVYVNGERTELSEVPMRRVDVLMRRSIAVEKVPPYLFGDRMRSRGEVGPTWYREQLERELRQQVVREPPFWISVLRRRDFEEKKADPCRVIESPPLGTPPGNDDIPF